MDHEPPASGGCEQFFGFAEPPFSLSINTRFRFDSESHRDALTQVTFALDRREPIVVLTGQIGTGKTLLCRTVVERLPRKTFLSVVHDPLLEPTDLLKRILEDFGVISAAGAARVQTSRHELVHALEKFLASLGQLDAHAVVILDEAQHLRPEVLEEIRLLANVQDSRGTLLQIVLVGQPSLRALVDTPELAQLRQRITRFVTLNPLSGDEVRRYIDYRVTVAREKQTRSTMPGAHDLAVAMANWNDLSRPVSFTDEAVAAVARLSGGVPRIVNLLCDRALETACAEQTRTVDEPHILAAASALELRTGQEQVAAEPSIDATTADQVAPRSSRRAIAAVAVLAGIALAVWIGGRAMRTTLQPTASPQMRPAPASPPAPQAAPATQGPKPPGPEPAPPPRPNTPAVEPPPPSPAPAERPSASAQAAAAGDESFEILVASFHTEARANEVARQISAMGQTVRQRSLGGWEQVLVGPFRSKAAADEEQQQLDRAGFKETVIVRAAR